MTWNRHPGNKLTSEVKLIDVRPVFVCNEETGARPGDSFTVPQVRHRYRDCLPKADRPKVFAQIQPHDPGSIICDGV